jgi:hypothetical protein
MAQGFAKDKLCISCYKAGTAQASSPNDQRVNHELRFLATDVADAASGGTHG